MLTDASAPPAEFCIFQPGVNRTTKGAFIFSEKSCASVMAAAAEYGNDFCIDYGHAMVMPLAADPAEAGKAAGWFRPVVRDGTLWATDVKWTPRAEAMLMAREYRYISPAFRHAPDGEIEELINVAITNIPATKQMMPLVASQDVSSPTATLAATEPNMKSLIALLSLAEKATESEVTAEVAVLKESATALLSATGKASVSEALGTIAAWKAGSEQTEALSARIASMELASRKADVKAIVDGAVRDGKATPAQVSVLSQMGEKDFDMLKAFIAASATVMPTQVREPAGATAVATLSQDEMKIAKMFGHKPEDIAALKAKIGGVPVADKEEATA